MQPTNRILERDRYGHYWADPEPPAYPCSNAECREAASDQETHHKCEACQKQFCADCLTRIGDLEYCPECSVCAQCAGPAINCCEECGHLLCPKCAAGPGLTPMGPTEVSELSRKASGEFCAFGKLVPCAANHMARAFPMWVPFYCGAATIPIAIRGSAAFALRRILERGCSCGAPVKIEKRSQSSESRQIQKARMA